MKINKILGPYKNYNISFSDTLGPARTNKIECGRSNLFRKCQAYIGKNLISNTYYIFYIFSQTKLPLEFPDKQSAINALDVQLLDKGYILCSKEEFDKYRILL